LTQATAKAYANFNTLTVSGRVYNAEIIRTANGEEFLSVSVISNLDKDGNAVTYSFTNANGIMALFNKGFLPVGRQVTIVGRIKAVAETYFDKKSGQTLMLKHPKITLEGVQIPSGGLGAMPADKTAPVRRTGVVVSPAQAQKDVHTQFNELLDRKAPVDEAPALAAVAPSSYQPLPEGGEDIF